MPERPYEVTEDGNAISIRVGDAGTARMVRAMLVLGGKEPSAIGLDAAEVQRRAEQAGGFSRITARSQAVREQLEAPVIAVDGMTAGEFDRLYERSLEAFEALGKATEGGIQISGPPQLKMASETKDYGIFLEYRNENRNLRRQFAAALERAGFKVGQDPNPGSSIADPIALVRMPQGKTGLDALEEITRTLGSVRQFPKTAGLE